MSQAPSTPYMPYASVHETTKGPGDARPTAFQIVQDLNATGTLKNKTILITGTSAGIGIETARALYETGAQLYLTARDIPKLNKIIEEIVSTSSHKDSFPRPQALEIHLDSLESVRKGAAEFLKRSDQLNILINNAGVMACPQGTTQDGFETQIGTNHFAHFLLFQLLKPTLLKSAKESGTTSRVINLSSTGHRRGGIRFDDVNFSEPGSYEKWAAYGQSKTANIYMASSITRHYSSQSLTALSVHPGGILTDLGRHLNESDYAVMGLDSFQHILKTPAQGAATTVWATLEPHFSNVQNGGRYLAECGESPPIEENAGLAANGYAKHVYDPEAEEKLWKLSYEAVGLPVED